MSFSNFRRIYPLKNVFGISNGYIRRKLSTNIKFRQLIFPTSILLTDFESYKWIFTVRNTFFCSVYVEIHFFFFFFCLINFISTPIGYVPPPSLTFSIVINKLSENSHLVFYELVWFNKNK